MTIQQDNGAYVLVHLGRKNAGPRILYETARVLESQGLLAGIICSSFSEEIEKTAVNFSNVLRIKTYRNKTTFIISIFMLPLRAIQIIKFIGRIKEYKVMFIMHHLWDPFILRILKIFTNCKIIYWIHDARHHPGEIKNINKILVSSGIKNADSIVVLSQHVRDEVTKFRNCPPIIQISHPIVTHEKSILSENESELQVLFVGRISKYKGLIRLSEAWQLVVEEFPTAKLVIAGDGDVEMAKRITSHLRNCKGIYKYLTENEFSSLILNSSVVVLPYDEASQSGILVRSVELGTPYVATPVGGIPEQHANLKGGLIALDMRASSFADALKIVLRGEFRGKEKSREEFSYNSQVLLLHETLVSQTK